MNPPAATATARFETGRGARASATRTKTLVLVAAIAGFVAWSHLGSGVAVFRSHVSAEPGWEKFRADYRVDHFGHDGHFVRAVQNGYNLVFYTYKYAPRFTRKNAADGVNACAGCHTAEDLAYSFVNSDRSDAKLGRRVSFEEHVQWCYAASVNGFVPTIYDPAVRDIRLFARAVAHHLQLSEGALKAKD
jgi:hypothetical protein